MADVAAKREARRRRILENSEYRLRRITGHLNHDESSDERNEKAVEAQSTVSNSTPNGISMSVPIVQNQTFDSLINEINANIDADEPSVKSEQIYAATQELLSHVLSGQNVPRAINQERRHASNDYGHKESFDRDGSNDPRFSRDRRDSRAGATPGNSERDIPAPNSSTSERSSSLIGVLSSRLVYAILAVLVNIMMILKIEHLFGTSVIVPFFVVMIGRMCACKNDDAAQGNNMLVAALILSNCRPDLVNVIQRLKGALSLFGKISRDLAVYIFTLVLLYTALSPCRDEAEAIFTNDIAT